MEKAIVFRNKETGEKFYMSGVTTYVPTHGQRKVVAKGTDRDGTQVRIEPHDLLGPLSVWEYARTAMYTA